MDDYEELDRVADAAGLPATGDRIAARLAAAGYSSDDAQRALDAGAIVCADPGGGGSGCGAFDSRSTYDACARAVRETCSADGGGGAAVAAETSAVSGDVGVRGVHGTVAAFAVVSRRHQALYIYRSRSSAAPWRAVPLQRLSHCGLEDSGSCIAVRPAVGDAETRLVVPGGIEEAGRWLEAITCPHANLRAQRSRNTARAAPSSPRGEPALADALSTPHLRSAFLEFTRRSFCEENVLFLEAVAAYMSLCDAHASERGGGGGGDSGGSDGSDGNAAFPLDPSLFRALACGAPTGGGASGAASPRSPRTRTPIGAAREVYAAFLAPDAPHCVNVDARTRDEARDAISAGRASRSLFAAAGRVVYALVDRDVYRRFLAGGAGPAAAADGSSGGDLVARHRRELSFRPVAMREDAVALAALAARFVAGVPERRVALRKRRLFAGAELVSWLLSQRAASSRSQAMAVAQRMADAGIVRAESKFGSRHGGGDSIFHGGDAGAPFCDSSATYEAALPADAGEPGGGAGEAGGEGDELLLLKSSCGLRYNAVAATTRSGRLHVHSGVSHARLATARLRGATARVSSDGPGGAAYVQLFPRGGGKEPPLTFRFCGGAREPGLARLVEAVEGGGASVEHRLGCKAD